MAQSTKKAKSTIDIDAIKEELRSEIEQQIKFEIARSQHVAEQQSQAQASLSRSELTLAGVKEYKFESNDDGLVIHENNKGLLTISKSGSAGFGTKNPRGSGLGSLHVRANYTSEAPLPSTGKNSTRGLIVEGDGDDKNSYALRVVSRKNRQGLNVTSDGNLILGTMNDATDSKLTIISNSNDTSTINIHSASKYFTGSLISAQSAKLPTRDFDFIKFSTDIEKNGDAGIDVFKVNGDGSVLTSGSYFTNNTGYAELFEWADGNPRNEDRTGYTVTLNEKSQLVIADEGDVVIGVISDSAAVIGNAGCFYQNRYYKKDNGAPATRKDHIVEWEDEVGVLHSYYLSSLSKEFALPDNAIIYESTDMGNDIVIPHVNDTFKRQQEYTERVDRGWAIVTITGRTKVFKGQQMNSNWFKVKNISDELEEWFLR